MAIATVKLVPAFLLLSVSCGLPWTPTTSLRHSDVNITTIYLVSSCHLDVGFADTAANIVNRYFDEFFPDAIRLAAQLREGGLQRLVFTTHTYLVSLFLDCPMSMGLHCPSESEKEAFLEAVRKGDITWHAFPFNTQPEVYDAAMAEFGFQMTHQLDDRLNRPHTMTMSQRDVPGLTRAMIPIMVRQGVGALTVGVNGGSMPPAVPAAFVWRDNASDTEILAMWHPRGYGGSNGVGLESMVIVPGMPYALAYAIRGDNTGPPSEREVIDNYVTLHKLFPEAEIVASGYDTFVHHLKDYKHLLPVYTEEIGDTWIHGAASDPQKTARYRMIQRVRSLCLKEGQCSLSDERFFNFSRLLIKYGEHTWGKDVKTYLHDLENWANDKFHSKESDPNYQDMVNSWFEQRQWAIHDPLEALQNHPLASDIEQELSKLDFDGKIMLEGFEEGCSGPDGYFQWGELELAFDPNGLHLTGLKDSRSTPPLNYAGDSNPLAKIVYETFTGEDFMSFLKQYLVDPSAPFSYLDFGKLGLDHTKHLHVSPVRVSCWHKTNRDQTPSVATLLLEGHFIDSKVVTDYGGAERMWVQFEVPEITDPTVEVPINITVFLVNKTSTRIPESLSLFFNPREVKPSSMVVSKLGQLINITEVVKNGSKHVHFSDHGVRYVDTPKLSFSARDTGVVAIGGTNVFPVPMATPDPSQGFAFNIFNNIWGTNYIMWWPYTDTDKSSMFQFTLTLPPLPTPAHQ